MKSKLLLVLILKISINTAQACTIETIDTLVGKIDPYYSSSVGETTKSTIDTLNLCDENLSYAGKKVGKKFDPYFQNSTYIMSNQIISNSKSLNKEFAYGLSLGIVSNLDLYFKNSTLYMLQALVNLGKLIPENTKQITIELLKHQDSYHQAANSYLLEAARFLTSIADKSSQLPDPSAPNAIWAFRSSNQKCDGISGSWGYYEICPRYFASISDKFGNRVVLACKSENFGIEFRVTLGNQTWNQLAGSDIGNLSFGTETISQSLGVPFVIQRAHSLMSAEPVADEILSLLKTSKKLVMRMRSNSGENNTQLTFSLKGSGKAIDKLLQYCQ